MSIATAERVSYRYPGAAEDAIERVTLRLAAGEVVLLEGASGSGKSTLLRAFCGLVPHFHGGRFAGRVRIGALDTRTAAMAELTRRAGLAFQDPEAQAVYNHVLRDVAFGLENHGVAAAALIARAHEALERVAASHLADRPIDTLSCGELQRVALAGVLAPRPPILLLDEPSAQLDDHAAGLLVAVVRGLADTGMAVLVAEHRADRFAPISDRRVALPSRERAPARPDVTMPIEPSALVTLRADGLELVRGGRRVLSGVGLAIGPGEVVALRGANGTGKTTLLRALAGLDQPAAGRVFLNGRDQAGVPAQRRYPVLVLVPQDPGRHLLCEHVRDEVALGGHDASRVLGMLDLEALAERHPRDLSVGERERVALAGGLAARPGLLLLDEPTRGMDQQRRAQLAALLRAYAARGASILVATHDAGFAAAAAQRSIVLASRDGPVVAAVGL